MLRYIYFVGPNHFSENFYDCEICMFVVSWQSYRKSYGLPVDSHKIIAGRSLKLQAKILNYN
jgi:hypothetical protein